MLRSHTASRRCIPVTLMNTRQQRTCRQARERREGESRGVIPVTLEAADGTDVEPVAEFVYLGSNITRDGDATKEMGTLRRRWGRHEGDGDATKEMGTPRR